MSKLLIIGTILACITIQWATAEPYPFADNVCNKSVPFRKDIIVEKPIEYEIKVQSMCGILPCTKTRVETRHDHTIRTIVVHEQRTTCCDGYAETPLRQCAPICLDSCNNGGKCVAPNVCKCLPGPSASAPGYVGPTCKRFACLAVQRWGAECERECPTKCSQNSYCSADSGKCLCYPGWHGPECALECEPDSDADDCQESSKLPAIMEPDVNLISSSGNQIVTSRSQQRAQALVLDQNDDDEIRIIATRANEGQAWANFASSYLIGVLGFMSLVFLVAFLIVKRRYELVRNELYYASAASAVSSRSRPGPGSQYSGSSDSASYYSAAAPGQPGSDDLEKNQSFATATRNILSGVVAGIGGGGKQAGESKSKLLLFTPRVESHLIRSQKEAEQNIYSEIDLSNTTRDNRASSGVANRARAQTPVRQPPTEAPAPVEDNIYAVPKSPVVSKAGVNNNNPKSQDTSLEIGYEDLSPIYEEIKPRGAGVHNKQ